MVVFENGDIKQLADCILELQEENDAEVRAEGMIRPDGSFELQTYRKGKRSPGVPAGTYRAWIVMSSEDGGEEARLRRSGLDPRFLDAKSSGLTVKVPPERNLTLKVGRAKAGTKSPATPP